MSVEVNIHCLDSIREESSLIARARKPSTHFDLILTGQYYCALTTHHKVQDTSASKLQNQKLITAADLRFSFATPSSNSNSIFF